MVTALGRAVQEEGHSVEVILPKYDCINYALVQGERGGTMGVWVDVRACVRVCKER